MPTFDTSTAVSAEEKGPHTFWGSVWEALRGSHQDFTSGNLNRSILLLAIPAWCWRWCWNRCSRSSMFSGSAGWARMLWLRWESPRRCWRWSLQSGWVWRSPRRRWWRGGLVKKDPEGGCRDGFGGAGDCAGVCWISAVLGAAGGFAAPHLLQMMGASAEIVAVGSGYARVALGGCGAIIMLFLNNAIFRGAGDASVAMRLLWVSNIINLILDQSCLIFGLRAVSSSGGYGDAATATFIGRSIGVLVQFWLLLKGTERIHIAKRRHLRLNFAVPLASGTGLAQRDSAICHFERQLDWPGSRSFAVWRGGSGWVYGCDPDRNLFYFAGMGAQQCGCDAGGAESWGREEARSCRAGGLANRFVQSDFFWGRSGGFLYCLCDAGGAELFVQDPAVVPIAATALRIFSCGNMGYAYVMSDFTAGIQRRRGYSDSDDYEFLRLLGAGTAALAWWLAVPMHVGVNGAFLAFVIAEFADRRGECIVLFKRGRWKRIRI